MKHLQTLSFSILINSDQKTIWDTLWNPKTYPAWTSVFCLGNHYEGELKEGNTIQFLNEEDEGMTSLIEKMVEYEQIAFVHQAHLKEGSDNDFEWKGAREIYHLKKETDSTAELQVNVDVTAEMKDNFNDVFPKALIVVKDISEKNYNH